MASHRSQSRRQASSSETQQATDNFVILVLISVFAFSALPKDGHNSIKTEPQHHLMDYPQFRASWPRYTPFEKLNPIEQVARQILFVDNLMSVGLFRLANLFGQRSARPHSQSPSTADRYPEERRVSIVQLEEWDLNPTGSTVIDSPVSGIKGSWLTRKLKGDSYFEVPHKPLEDQPDPERVTHIDSDLRQFSGPVREQRGCGACYAFSWLAMLEWHYKRQSGKEVEFSPQHMIDCGRQKGLRGCLDGYLVDAQRFSAEFGLHLERDYPYQAKEGKCLRLQGTESVQVSEFQRLKVSREQWEAVLEEQPILVEVHLPRELSSGWRGLYPSDNCDANMAHGMLLVGHGRDEGQAYWLLRNSMGRKWGENGYLRLSRDGNMKGCFATGFVGKFRFKSLSEFADGSYEAFYDNLQFQDYELQENRPRTGVNRAFAKLINQNLDS